VKWPEAIFLCVLVLAITYHCHPANAAEVGPWSVVSTEEIGVRR
jgi:hypothetical protein